MGMRVKSLAIALIITAVGAVFLLYHFHTLNLVTISNESNDTLTNVTVTSAGDIRWRGDIKAGEILKFRFVAERDGAIEIVGTRKGNTFKSQPMGYVTSARGITVDITFNERGLFSFYSSP
jgi:hypothetical protein